MPATPVATGSSKDDPSKVIAVRKLKPMLKTVQDVLNEVHPPIAQLVIMTTQLDGYIKEGISFAGYVEDLLKLLKDAFQLCKYLGELIPEVGPILADAAAFIERLNIEDKVRRIVHEIRNILTKAHDGVLKKVKDAATKVVQGLEDAIRRIPGWVDVATILEGIYFCIDIFVPFFFGSSEEAQKWVYAELQSLAGDSFQFVGHLAEILGSIKVFVHDVWNSLNEAIFEPIRAGFKAILDTLKPVMDVIKSCAGICNTIKGWFEPFFWVLGAIQWIFDHTVGWLIDKIMDGLGLKQFIKDFMKTIQDKLGITAIKEALRHVFEDALQTLCEPIAKIAGGENVQSIVFVLSILAKIMENFRAHPAKTLIDVTRKGLVAKHRTSPLHPIKPPVQNEAMRLMRTRSVLPTQQKAAAMPGAGNKDVVRFDQTTSADKAPEKQREDTAVAQGKEEVERIKAQQRHMDEFIYTTGKSDNHINAISAAAVPSGLLAASNIRQGPTAAPAGLKPAPILCYATTDGDSVSVLLRTKHRRVLDAQAQARMSMLQPIKFSPDMKFNGQSPTLESAEMRLEKGPMTSATAQSKSSSHFQNFSAMYFQLKSEIDLVEEYNVQMLAAAEQADADFGSYRPEAATFFDHFVGLLDGADPILDTISALLKLPLEYSQLLASQISTALHDLFLTDVAAETIRGILAKVSIVIEAVDTFRLKKAGVREASTIATASYSRFHSHVASICTPERFSALKMLRATSLREIIAALTMQLENLRSSFTFVYNMGNQIYSRQDELQGDSATVIAKLDNVFRDLEGVAAKTIDKVRQVPSRVSRLHETLVKVHKDAVAFFQHSEDLSNKCRAVEEKLIAVDRVRELCNRVNSALGPLKEFLGPSDVAVDLKKVPGAEVIAESTAEQISEFFAEVVFAGVTAILDEFFELDKLHADIESFSDQLDKPFEGDVVEFENALRDLLALLEPEHTNTYTPNATAAGGSATTTTTFPVANPLLTEESAQTLSQVLHDVVILAGGVKFQDETEPTSKSIRVPRWSKPRVDEAKLRSVVLRVRGTAWDRLEPEHPSEVFIAVYEVLEKLDSLMRKRGEGKWQRLIAAGGDVDPPADLGLQRPTDVQLWKLLERLAARGGSRYDVDIARPLWQPLHDRVEQLVQGTIQLSGHAASGDILKLLTSAIAKSGITSPVYYALPDAAVAAASIQKISDKETKLSVVPEAIFDLFSDQEAFENVRFDLLTRLPPPPVATDGGDTGSAAALPFSTSVISEALTDLHHDHNYMGARKLLELTRDGPKSREFLKAAEGEKFLEQQIGSCGLRS